MNELHELLARVAALPGGFTAVVTLHGVPAETALEWLQLGLLDSIEPGAGGNPPTGKFDRVLNAELRRKAEAVVFTDGPRRQAVGDEYQLIA